MATLTIILGTTAASILGLISLFAWALRRRWFSRFHNGFVVALMIALGGTGLATTAAVGLWGYEAAQRIVFQQLVSGMSNIGGVVESQLDRDLLHTAKSLDHLAAGDLAHAAIANPDAARAQLAELQQFNHRLLQINVCDSGGRMILQTSRTDKAEPADPTAIGYTLHTGKPFISAPYRSESFGRYVISLSSPVMDSGGHAIGAVSLTYNLQAAASNLVGQVTFGSSGRAILVDNAGHILAHPDAKFIGRDISAYPSYHAAQASDQGWVVANNASGDPTLYIFQKVHSPSTLAAKPMLLLTDISVAEAMAPVHKLALEFLGGAAAIVIFWVLCARRAAADLTRPLTDLLELVQKVGDHDLTARSTLEGRDEFGRFAAAFNTMVQGLTERDRIKQIFGRYVTTQVSERILKGDVNLGGQSRSVTMLFSDIRNFTGMSESMAPAQVVEFLNAYFSEMVDAVFEHGGVLDKFIGDGMLATFGSVDDAPNPWGRAVQTAMRMKSKLAALNAQREAAGKPPIHIGIGIHTEEVIVGNIGSRKRSEYTVIGDGVNTCSRVEAMNKDFGTTVLITQSTYEHVHADFECRAMPETKLRGKTQSLKLFEVVCERVAVAAAA
jgi:class 3 adenylate cyclase